jgi:hypothetical protein
VIALRFCWAVLGAPTGKRLAPVMDELRPRRLCPSMPGGSLGVPHRAAASRASTIETSLP